MSTLTRHRAEGSPAIGARGFRVPAILMPGRLELNALALMVATVATAGLGLVFWTVAARLYAPAEVGAGQALVSTLAVLAQLAQFNLGNVYARFLPGAGQRSRRFVLAGYGAVLACSVVLGVGFLQLGLADSVVTTGPVRWWFPVMVAVLAVFGLQDFVLVAIHAAKLVPLENVLFSVAKIVILVAVAGLLPNGGIVVAWVIPAAGAVAVMSVFLFHRRLPAPSWRHVPPGHLPAVRTLGQVVAGEYFSGAVMFIVPMALPLLVVQQLGAEANAYFAIPWLVASALNMLIWNVASSLLVEAAHEPARARHLVRRALRLALATGAAGALVLIAAAPLVLGVIGPGYAERGTDALRMMALAVPFNAVLIAWATMMRINNRMRVLVVQQLAAGVGELVLTVLLLPVLGITGAGVSTLAVQALFAALLAPSLRRMLRQPAGTGPAPSPSPAQAQAQAQAQASSPSVPPPSDWPVGVETPNEPRLPSPEPEASMPAVTTPPRKG